MKLFGLAVMGLTSLLAVAQVAKAESSLTNSSSDNSDLTLSPTYQSTDPIYQSQIYGGWSGHISYAIGYEKMDNDWGSASDRFQYGVVDIDFRPPDFGVNFVFQVLSSYSDNAPPQPGAAGNWSQTYEINLGVRKLFENDSAFVPFIGGGGSIVGAQTKTTISNNVYLRDNEWGFGLWAGAGCYWHITESFHIGAAVQYTWANMDLTGQGDLNAGGIHVMFLIGGHW